MREKGRQGKEGERRERGREGEGKEGRERNMSSERCPSYKIATAVINSRSIQ